MPRVSPYRRGRPFVVPRLLASCIAFALTALALTACSDRPAPVAPEEPDTPILESSARGDRVVSVDVTPASASMAADDTVRFTATARDAKGNALTGRVLTWTTSDSTIATVSPAGLVTALVSGTATITAASGGKSGKATVTVASSAPPPPPIDSIPVLPGLAGFGVRTPAGRGGTVYRVTNLNDNGAGSLREAVAATGPRVVVFEVSGTIALQSRLVISSPFITIAGQTAPPPGILLRNYGVTIRTHDVLVQHVRVRVGDLFGGNNHGLNVLGPASNVVVDHVSVSWGIDENVATWYSGVHDVTFSNMIITEGLQHPVVRPDMEAKAILVGDSTRALSMIGNLLANHQDRHPYFKGHSTAVFANNVVHNWGGFQASYMSDPEGSGPLQASLVGNVYTRGPETDYGRPIQVLSAVAAGTLVHVADNSETTVNDGLPPSDPWTLVRNDDGPAVVASTPPVWPAGFTPLTNAQVMSSVLARAGAYPAFRDAVDERAVSNVQSGTGTIITSQTQVGGYPALAATSRPLTLPANANGDDDGDGYTNLEEWLHQFAAAVEGR